MAYTVSITIHKSKDLPKADTFGKIDAYYTVDLTDAKSTSQLLRHVGTTSTIESNYNPKHKKTFRLNYDSFEAFNKDREHGQILLRLFDKDKVGKSDAVGEVALRFPPSPLYKGTAILTLYKGYKPSSGHQSLVIFSIGWIKTKEHLASTISLNNPNVIVHKDKVLNLIGSAFGLAPDGIILVAEYEKDCLDIKLWCTSNTYAKMLEMAYDKSGLKYMCQKKTWATGEKMGDFTVYQELKLDDVPFHYDFNKLTIWASDKVLVSERSGAEILNSHGWSGLMDYKQAKAKCTNVVCDDKKESIAMFENDACFFIDFDKDNIDFFWGVYAEEATKGVVADMLYKPQTNPSTRNLVYLSKPKKIKNHHIGMQVKIDDIKGQIMASNFVLHLHQRSNTVILPLCTYLPCQ